MAVRAIVVTDPKLPPTENWELVTKDKPKASAGNVVVRITLRPANPTDQLAAKGYSGQGKEFIIGSEGVGYVDEVGDGVTKVKKGQRVVPSFFKQYRQGNGSWQDFVEIPENELFILPESIPDETAAQFIINPWTAYGLLKDQDIPKGEYILQNAAGSVLGRQIIQLAKHWGIKTINIVRRDDAKDELKELGADEVINSSTEDVLARVKEITGGKMAAGALDAVAGKQAKVLTSCVKNGGKVFVYGVLGSPEFDVVTSISDLGRVNIRLWILFAFVEGDERVAEVAGAVTKLLEDKVIVPLTGKTFKFADFKSALVEAEKSGKGGKTLLSSEA